MNQGVKGKGISGMEQVGEGSKTVVELKAVTWSKDSHGLFDYESKHMNFNKFKIQEAVIKFIRQGSQLILKDYYNIIGDEVQVLDEGMPRNLAAIEPPQEILSIQQNHQNQFHIQPVEEQREVSEQSCFLIVRSIKKYSQGQQLGYPLQKGDIIKLGRIEYKVLELNQGESSSQSQAPPQEVQVLSDPSDDSLCRVCFSTAYEGDTSSNDSLKLSLCHCKGTCEIIHLGCLKNWLNFNLSTKNTLKSNQFFYKKFECDLCKMPYPRRVMVQGKEIEITMMTRPQEHYILLENNQKDANNSKEIFMVHSLKEVEGEPELAEVKLGRGHACEIRIADISVSRIHAKIQLVNGKFLLFDNNSKFGTLVLLQKPFLITTDKKAIQIGRTVFTFIVKPVGPEQQAKMFSMKGTSINPQPLLINNHPDNEPDQKDLNTSLTMKQTQPKIQSNCHNNNNISNDSQS